MAKKTIVIVGGALSGPTAAARARETDPKARIVLLERSRDINYAVGGLASGVARETGPIAALNRDKADFFADVYGVEARVRASVSAIDVKRRVVSADGEALAYDSLIYAAGAESVAPGIAGLEGARNALRFRTLLDLEAVLAALQHGAKHVVVIGGGLLGVEAADGFLRRGCRVTVIESSPRLLPRFSQALSMAGAAALEKAGATVLTGTCASSALRSGDRIRSLTLTSGRSIAADLVILAAGLRPRTKLLARAGVTLRPDGTVAVDKRCAASAPGLFACGVCVSLPHAVTGKPFWLAQAAQADKTAQVAGANAAGGRALMAPVTGTAIVRVGELTLARTGLDESAARRFAGKRFACARAHAPSLDAFQPGSTPVSIALFYDEGSGRLLGAELSGRAGVDKRVDVLATALAGKLTVEALSLLDLAYAPPYNAARDPINVAGSVASAARQGPARAWDARELSGSLGRVTIVDLRAPSERRTGSIAGAKRATLAQARLGKVNAGGKPIVFVSSTGRRSYLAARLSGKAGFLSGGLASWQAAGLPLSDNRRP